MSRPLLLRLQREHAFDHRPPSRNLGVYHVPYRQLTGQPLEDRLGNAVRRGECVAVVGASGSGKSSLIQHVLGPAEEGIAPIMVPIAVESVDIGDLGEVVALIVQAIEKAIGDLPDAVMEGALGSVAPTRSVGPGGAWSGEVGVSWLTAGLRTSLERQLPERAELKRSAASARESLATVLATIEGDGRDLMPVLVFDDTDRLLTAGTGRREVAQRFFSTVLPALRDLRAAVAVAAQSSYFGDSGLREHLASVMTDRIDVPRLPSSDAIAKVLASRVRCHADAAARLDEVITDEAVERLYELYATDFDGALRKVIGRVHPALVDACESGHRTISLAVIEQAVL